jgi:hypothetical protein
LIFRVAKVLLIFGREKASEKKEQLLGRSCQLLLRFLFFIPSEKEVKLDELQSDGSGIIDGMAVPHF